MHKQVERVQRLNSGAGRKTAGAILWLAVAALSSAACGSEDTNSGGGSGGAATAGGNPGQGGAVAGGATGVTTGNTGGTIGSGGSDNVGGSGVSGGSQAPSGGKAASGGSSQATSSGAVSTASTGGTAAGGAATGGKAAGGAPAGGTATGGAATGGKAAGGTGTGGKAAGGTETGGAGTGGAASGGATGTGGCLDGPAVVVPSGYKLVWSDEFNVDGRPDSANWGYESGMVRNNEAQYYQQDNAFVEKGCLVIEARKEKKENASYTSSSLRTMGKQSWQYGRFEMRARIKTETGLWPAWWMLGNSGSWPACGEIDIMEYYGGQVRANVACERNGSAYWDGAGWDVAGFEDKQWQSKFHLWRMDWDDQKIVLFLDDKQVNTTNLSDMLNSDGKSPFKQKQYMLVNLALGGNSGGSLTNTKFPSRYEVDYIRVFQKQ